MAISFHGGPAEGTKLAFSRFPLYLRVVVDANDKVDVLDQLADTPRDNETIHAYRMLLRAKNMGIACGRGGCKPIIDGAYRYVEAQPEDATMRDSAMWAAWCRAEHDREKKDGRDDA